MIYKISDISSLYKLRQEKQLKNSIRRIELQMDDPSQPLLEKNLNNHFFACGCKEGSLMVSITMLMLFIIWAATGFPSMAWWQPILCLAAAAIIGKIIGLIISSVKLKNTFTYLEKYFINLNQHSFTSEQS